MRKNFLVALLLLPFTLLFLAASYGGPCTYKKFAGTTVITAINPADPKAYNGKNDPVEVMFDFIPDNPADRAKYRFPNIPDTGNRLTVGGGMNPCRSYMALKGIKVGNRYRCNREEIVKGTCTPVVFQFTGLDLSDFAKYCF